MTSFIASAIILLALSNGSPVLGLEQQGLSRHDMEGSFWGGGQPVNHKPLFPISLRDVLIMIAAGSIMFLAANAGVGGGGILLPIYAILGGFAPRCSVALCNVTVAGGAVANFLFNVQHRQTETGLPVIDWNLVVLLQPTMMIGAVLGGYLNVVLPVWFSTLILTLLLIYLAVKLTLQACRLLIAEQRLLTAHAHATKDGEGLGQALLQDSPAAEAHDPVEPISDDVVHIVPTSADPSHELAAQLEAAEGDERRALPIGKVALIVLMMVWVMVSDTAKRALQCGSLWYWVAVVSLVPCSVTVWAVARHRLLRIARIKEQLGITHKLGDIHWDGHTTLVYPAFCTLAGVIAGLFGVGGGTITGPFLLELGVSPEVTAATSATMILVTTGSASIVHLSFGFIPHDYGVMVTVLGFTAALLGHVVMHRVMSHQPQRRSPIVVLMAIVLSISAVLMCYRATVEILKVVKEPELILEWGSVCPRT